MNKKLRIGFLCIQFVLLAGSTTVCYGGFWSDLWNSLFGGGGGASCSNTGTANSGGANSGSGSTNDPVDTSNGNNLLTYRDIYVPSYGPAIDLTRRYNSQVITPLEGFERLWGQSGSWAIENNELSGEGGRIHTTREFADFTMEVDMKTITAGLQNWETAWLDFKFTDLGNFYYFIITKDGTLELTKQKNGNKSIIVQKPSSYDPFIWHRVRVESKGDRIKIYVDGSLEINYLDLDPLAKGKLGLNTMMFCHAHFDNVKISGDTLFTSDFNQALGWKPANGDWAVEEHSYKGTDGLALTETAWSDFVMQVDMKTLRAGYSDWDTAWVRFRYQDEGNGYYFLIKTNGHIELTKLRDYQQSILVQKYVPYTPANDPYNWNKLRIEAVGGAIRVYLNDKMEIEYEDPAPISEGRFGLQALHSTALFDNFSVITDFDGMQNNFNNVGGWETVYGEWRAEEGVYQSDTGRIVSDKSWGDFTLDMDVRTKRPGGLSVGDGLGRLSV